MRLRAHPPSIARTTHGMPDPVKVSYLPHRASSVRVMEGARDESVPVERRLLAGFRRCRIGDRWLAARGTVAS
jgi:hypothetical protein